MLCALFVRAQGDGWVKKGARERRDEWFFNPLAPPPWQRARISQHRGNPAECSSSLALSLSLSFFAICRLSYIFFSRNFTVCNWWCSTDALDILFFFYSFSAAGSAGSCTHSKRKREEKNERIDASLNNNDKRLSKLSVSSSTLRCSFSIFSILPPPLPISFPFFFLIDEFSECAT